MTTFSVIIATRNRPALFAEALNSVLEQKAAPAEIIVVDDGSDDSHRAAYETTLAAAGPVARRFGLIHRPRGHGGAYSVNFGAARAAGDYLCFLDDDDRWTDPHHLERARAVVEGAAERVDLYVSNQIAVARGERKPGPVWIEDLAPILRDEGRTCDASGAYSVSVADLLRSAGFCHLNTLVVRRSLFDEIGGLDETNRWEYDRDLYLRLIDRARAIRYSPEFVSQHNVPDPALMSSMTTSLSEFERRLYQLRVLDRASLFASHAAIRAHGRRHKAYSLKKIAEALAKDGRHTEAAFYAREALGAGPTLKWAGYTLWRTLRSLA